MAIMNQSNCFKYQKFMASYNFIETQKGFYSSYWDTGIYGNYFVCDPKKALDVIRLNIEAYASKFAIILDYANNISDE
jgi:hypothetical protein